MGAPRRRSRRGMGHAALHSPSSPGEGGGRPRRQPDQGWGIIAIITNKRGVMIGSTGWSHNKRGERGGTKG